MANCYAREHACASNNPFARTWNPLIECRGYCTRTASSPRKGSATTAETASASSTEVPDKIVPFAMGERAARAIRGARLFSRAGKTIARMRPNICSTKSSRSAREMSAVLCGRQAQDGRPAFTCFALPSLIETRLGSGAGCFGMRTERTPLAISASRWSPSTVFGSENDRANAPYELSTRW